MTDLHIEDDRDNYSLENTNRMNEQLAVLSGLSCLFEYMAERKEYLFTDPNDQSKIDLILPKTFYNKDKEHSSYLDSLVRALFYTNAASIINPLLLSHIYFFIEKYHRQSIELNILKKELSKTT